MKTKLFNSLAYLWFLPWVLLKIVSFLVFSVSGVVYYVLIMNQVDEYVILIAKEFCALGFDKLFVPDRAINTEEIQEQKGVYIDPEAPTDAFLIAHGKRYILQDKVAEMIEQHTEQACVELQKESLHFQQKTIEAQEIINSFFMHNVSSSSITHPLRITMDKARIFLQEQTDNSKEENGEKKV